MKTQMKLTPRPSQKMQLKRSLLYTGIGIALTTILGVLCFFYLNIGNSDEAFANTVFNTRAGGSWESNDSWNNAPRPGLTLSNKQEVNINLGHEVVVETNLLFQQNTILRVFGTLVIRGNLTMEQGTRLIVESGGILIVMGNFDAQHQQEFVNNGDIVFLNNISTSHQSTYSNTGRIYADAPFPSSGVQPESDIQNNTRLYNVMASYHNFSNLPVTLISFSIEDATDRVNVYWSTANEKNNDFFSIERSDDGKKFEVIGKVDGFGNSLEPLKYSFVDHNPVVGRSYYRLKQTDYDGEFEYFEIATVNRQSTGEDFKIVSVGPNPFSDQFTVNFHAESDGAVEMHLISTRGEQVASQRFQASAGLNQFNFTEGYRLPKDIYFLRLMQNGKTTKSLRLIKK